jgi:hypothetical protein
MEADRRYLEPFRGEAVSLIEQGRDAVRRVIDENGGYLLLHFSEDDWTVQKIEQIFSEWEQMDYMGGTNNRGSISEGSSILQVGGEPTHRDLPFHQEMAYAASFPAYIAFACLKAPPAGTGGETTVASAAGIFERLPDDMKISLQRRGICHRFTYGDAEQAVRPWQDAFGTDSRYEALEKCTASGYSDAIFNEHGDLTCTLTCANFVEHPRTQALTMFQTDLSAKWYDNWDPYGKLPFERQPYSFAYGDGEAVDARHSQAWIDATKRETWDVKWRKGDLLICDNLKMMHGRRKYDGRPDERKLGVVLLEPYQRHALDAVGNGHREIWSDKLEQVRNEDTHQGTSKGARRSRL